MGADRRSDDAARPDRARRWLGPVTLAALAAQATIVLVVSWIYVPARVDGQGPRGSGAGWSDALVSFRGVLAPVTILLALAWAGVSVVAARGTSRRVLTAACGAVSVVAVLAAASAWSVVTWDQAALWSVEVGHGMRGLWALGDAGKVRFVLIDGAEMGPRTFTGWVLVAVVAPLVALASFVAGWWVSRPVRSTSAVSRASHLGAGAG